ncbi:MAG: hypothetical protein EP338_00115 [Bacteroidetes bacterium]|nr:MAG: hypothetical protein EP338_00115 [Bacteroidota bacterium]
MKQTDYQLHLVELISLIRDKSTYLQSIEKDSEEYDKNTFEGMALAYHFVMDGIKTYVECNEDLSLEEFGLEDYDPSEILEYKPKES